MNKRFLGALLCLELSAFLLIGQSVASDISGYDFDTGLPASQLFSEIKDRAAALQPKNYAPMSHHKDQAPFTIDQQAWVVPLIARVKEQELRSTIETLSAYPTRYYKSKAGVEAALWIKSRWQDLAENIPGASAQLFHHKKFPQPTVILTIPGSENPGKIIVLGAHLDSISINRRDKSCDSKRSPEEARAPGADDDASGIAVLTEAIRLLGETGFRPASTLQFIGYAAEEVGLRGSDDIAHQYKLAHKNVAGVIQFDMTNFKGSPEQIYLVTDHVDKQLTAYVGKLIDAYLGASHSTTRCNYKCSDHASWQGKGFPASMAEEAAFKDESQAIHSNKDTLANSGGSAEHSVAFAKLAIAFAVEMAKSVSQPNLAQDPDAKPAL